jgi:hypothetical protein
LAVASTPQALIETVLRLDDWSSALPSQGLDSALSRVSGSEDLVDAADIIAAVSGHLTGHVAGIQGDLLSKSLQEALFYCTGTDPALTRAEFEERLLRFLKRRGTGALIRHFLSLHVFNMIWLQSGELLRGSAQSNESFVQDMENLERACRRIVDGAFRKASYPLTPGSAEQLISEIRHRLDDLQS